MLVEKIVRCAMFIYAPVSADMNNALCNGLLAVFEVTHIRMCMNN